MQELFVALYASAPESAQMRRREASTIGNSLGLDYTELLNDQCLQWLENDAI
jgi:hypothetical protein